MEILPRASKKAPCRAQLSLRAVQAQRRGKFILCNFPIGEEKELPKMNFFERVYEIVRRIPEGRVMSYGRIAALAGNPRMARQVGWALHSLSEDDVPWHRVVRKDGSMPERLSEATDRLQQSLLEAEGVEFDLAGRVCREYFCEEV